VSALRVTVTGATGLIGSALLAALRERDAHVTVLSRDPERALATLGAGGRAPAGRCGGSRSRNAHRRTRLRGATR